MSMSRRSVSASAGHRGQQTLFDCVKRKKQSFDDGDDSASVGPSTTQGQTQQQGNFVTVPAEPQWTLYHYYQC